MLGRQVACRARGLRTVAYAATAVGGCVEAVSRFGLSVTRCCGRKSMNAVPDSRGLRKMSPCYVGVVGPGAADSATYDIAREVGRLVVERLAATVVCGGLGGVMEAAARGAAEAGGMSVGFLPGSDRSEANEYVAVSVPTGLGELRDGLVVNASNALVVVGGSWGTLVEVALASKRGLPVMSLGGWSVSDDHGGAWSGITRCSDPEQAMNLLAELLRPSQS